MARSTVATYQIIKIEPTPKGRKITVRFDDGKGPKWEQSFVINHADRPISLEEFMLKIKDDIKRPINYFEYLEKELNKAHTIHLDS